MANEEKQAYKKLDSFFRMAIQYYGKEIGLTSNQYFSIDQINDPDKEQKGEYRYVIQYGFPQSGCVNVNFNYSKECNTFTIDKASVYAPPAGKNVIVANFAPQTQADEVGIGVNFGMDMGTQEHSSIQEIEKNPNALKILDIATSDLNNAQVLGECRVAVPEESDRIPCCTSTSITNKKERHI